MDARTPLFSFAALLPCSPARPPPPPQLPTPPLAYASRSSTAPLACHLNLPFFNPKIISSSSRLRLLLACGDGTSSSSTPPPEETRGRQQWLALRLCDLGCAWAAASRAYAPVAASAVRPSAEEDEGDSVRRQGVLDLLHTDPAAPNFVPEDGKTRYTFFILTRHDLRFECSSSCEIQQHCHVHGQRSSSNTGRGRGAELHRDMGVATGALLMIKTTTARELRINFTLYQLQDEKRTTRGRGGGLGGSGAGIGWRRRRPPAAAAEAEASPTTTTTTSRRLKRTSTVTSPTAVSGGIVGEVDQRRGGGWRRTRLSVGGGGPVRGWACRRRRTFSWRRLAAEAGCGDAGGGRRKEVDGGFISRALQVEGLKCKKSNVLRPRHEFRDGGSISY